MNANMTEFRWVSKIFGKLWFGSKAKVHIFEIQLINTVRYALYLSYDSL